MVKIGFRCISECWEVYFSVQKCVKDMEVCMRPPLPTATTTPRGSGGLLGAPTSRKASAAVAPPSAPAIQSTAAPPQPIVAPPVAPAPVAPTGPVTAPTAAVAQSTPTMAQLQQQQAADYAAVAAGLFQYQPTPSVAAATAAAANNTTPYFAYQPPLAAVWPYSKLLLT